MSEYTVAVVGTGPDPTVPTVEGFAMGYRHAEAYRNTEACELVACADIVPANARAFADEFGLPEPAVFEDYRAMVREVEPDIVSVCVPPPSHEPIVVDCARTGLVDAIHCEKPMGHTLASAERQVQECWRRGVQLTYNRQRRFGRPFTEAKRLLDAGEIGDLRRVEIELGDLYDTGAHTIDLAGMYNGDRPAEWVIAQIDYREADVRFGLHQENQAWARWRYENGVYGVLSTGVGEQPEDAAMTLRGTAGEIRIGVSGGPMLELARDGTRESVDVGRETFHTADPGETITNPGPGERFGSSYHDRAIGEVVEALEADRESVLSGRIGLNTAEIIFGAYESVRRRGRVEFPVDIDDNPLSEMVASGALSPTSAEAETGSDSASED